MIKYKILIVFGILLFLLPIASAERGHMRLLAISETNDGQIGGIADLFLEINPGSGRVFLETFPLTRIDTQISTRFAKQIACDFADIDCSKFDFFYTITADSSIIAGPSAGAAISVLTFSLIKGIDIDENTAITGTINSGGLIGPVGGLKAKIEAADKVGLKKVLIPLGESIEIEINSSQNQTNETFDLIKLRKKHKKLNILEISTLDEAIFEFTGKRFRVKKEEISEVKDVEKEKAEQELVIQEIKSGLLKKFENISAGEEAKEKLPVKTIKKEFIEKAKKEPENVIDVRLEDKDRKLLLRNIAKKNIVRAKIQEVSDKLKEEKDIQLIDEELEKIKKEIEEKDTIANELREIEKGYEEASNKLNIEKVFNTFEDKDDITGKSENITVVSLFLKPKKILYNVSIYEEIPKDIASNANEIIFYSSNYDVIEEDPLIAWQFVTVSSDTEIHYGLKGTPSAELLEKTKTIPIVQSSDEEVPVEEIQPKSDSFFSIIFSFFMTAFIVVIVIIFRKFKSSKKLKK